MKGGGKIIFFVDKISEKLKRINAKINTNNKFRMVTT